MRLFFFSLFGKSKIFTFFLSKIHFLLKVLKICQHTLNVSVFNLNINPRSMPQETKHFLHMLRVLRRETNFKAATEEFATTDNRHTSLSEASGTHIQCLWWLALVYVWFILTPLNSPNTSPKMFFFVWVYTNKTLKLN